MFRHKCFIFITTILLCFFGVFVSAFGEDTEMTEVEEETTAEESDINMQIMNNVTNGDLGDYWKETASGLTDSKHQIQEGGLLFRVVMTISTFCRKGGWVLAILSLLVGIVLNLVSGMNKPLRRVSVFLMVGVPLLTLTIAFVVPITASIFFYGN